MGRFPLLKSRRLLVVVLSLSLIVGGGGVGVAVALEGDDGPPPDLWAEDPDLFWQNLTPEQRADVKTEYPPEDGVIFPEVSDAEAQAFLDTYWPASPDVPPEAGIFDVESGSKDGFQPINYWRELTPTGTNQFSILTVFAGYNQLAASGEGVLEVLAETWPDGSGPNGRTFYDAPSGVGPLRIVSADGHLLSLAGADDPAGNVILLFDVDSRSFLTPIGTGGGGGGCGSCPPGLNCPDVCTTGTSQADTLRTWRRRP